MKECQTTTYMDVCVLVLNVRIKKIIIRGCTLHLAHLQLNRVALLSLSLQPGLWLHLYKNNHKHF